MRKYSFSVILLLVLLLSFQTVAAKDLSVFYSNVNKIAYDPLRNVRASNIDGFTDSDFNAYVAHARQQWAGAGISTWDTSYHDDISIEIFGGTRSTLESIEPDLVNYMALAVVLMNPDGTHTYNGTTISNYKISSSRVYVPKQPWYYLWGTSEYYSSFIHELGHALGWLGHSPDSKDVMYSKPGTITTLTSRDKTHLKQNY